MIFARGVCLAVVAAVAWFVRWIPGYLSDQKMALFLILLSIPLAAAALTTLALSFFRIEKQGDQLLISRNNAYIQFIHAVFGPGKMTVCGLFWSTVLLLIFAVFLLAMVSFLLYGLYNVITGDVPKGTPMSSKDWVMIGGMIVAIAFAFLGIIMKDVAVSTSWKRVGWGLVGLGCLLLLANATFLGPLWGIAEENKVSLFGALPAYWELFKEWAPGFLAAIGIIAAVLGTVVGLIIGLFASIKALRKSLVGQILVAGWQAIKTRTCPIVSVIQPDNPVEEAPPPASGSQ